MWTRSRGSSSRAFATGLLLLLLTGPAAVVAAPARESGNAGAPRRSAARAADAGDAATRTARAVLRNHRYQTTLPTAHDARLFRFRIPQLLPGAVVRALVIAVLAALLVVLIVHLRRRARDEQPAAQPAARAPARVGSLARAEQLAAEGRYGDAVHALLLLALESLAGFEGAAPHSADTSREVLRALPRSVAPERRQALASLVRQVELGWFGGRLFGPEDFADGLHSYRRFMEA